MLIEEILPASASCAEERGDPVDVPIFPEEAALVARAVPKRRLEFTSARGCARRALSALGVPPAPILTGERGAPVWPAGIVGTITHCAGYRGAAVARDRDLRALGVDAEPDQPLPDGVLGAVSLPAERSMLAGLPSSGPCWDRLLFCAKEATYKAWFPLTGRWLGFADARITLNPDGGTFTAELLADDPPLPAFAGRWLARDGLLLTAIALPASRASLHSA